MGEKFTTNAVTGTGSFSVPIPVTPSRGSVTPALALRYDSGAGNGPFGLGWSLDVGSIVRRTDNGVPRYVDGSDDPTLADVFQLSGAEDLVPELEARLDGDVEVRRYLPRTETGFSRIERVRDRRTADTYWRVITRDNVTSVFGRSAATRITAPEDPLRVFRWLLEETHDDKGNVVRYDYKPEDHAGVDPAAPYERNRLNGRAAPANRYLKRIRYGNARPGQAAGFSFELVLDYGEHDPRQTTPAERMSWPARLDAFSAYRSGFEVRTYRLCRRILMFHRFPELGPDPVLVRSTDLEYEEDPTLSRLVSVTHRGFLKTGDEYTSRPLPKLEFSYSERVLTAEASPLTTLPGESPPRLTGAAHHWADIDGEGISGILADDGQGAWHYRRNLGQGVLAGPCPVDPLPAGAGLTAGRQLTDLDGDGRDELVSLAPPMPGSYRRNRDSWDGFEAFTSLPVLPYADPNLRFVDLTGDGLADLLFTDDDGLRWYPSLGVAGYGDASLRAFAGDEDNGPRLVFADAEHCVYLADMTGDGLTDLVRIRSGEVAYWPNLGHGRFGPKVAMAAPPAFDHPDRFDQRRIRLFDIDGSAPADLVYLGPDGVRVWFNQSGNSWSAERSLGVLFAPSLSDNVFVADVLGKGTACLVVAEDRPDGESQLRYVDLMAAGKPHLLTVVDNGMGLRTTIRYTSSTSFYVADQAAGRPWLTRLPFPVHVVAETRTYDSVADTELVTTYAYRHGHYDGREREFRGFGYVEQRDAPTYAAGTDDPLTQPPTLVKRWQHTGWSAERETLSKSFALEYWQGDVGEPPPATVLPPDLTGDEEREACRALRGLVLREEIYAEDGDAERAGNPYSVSEYGYAVRLLRRARPGSHAVFHAYPEQVFTAHTERKAEDPRVTRELTLAVDEWGNVLRSAQVAYPRRVPVDPEQAKLVITYAEHEILNDVGHGDRWRIGLPVETRTYEIGGVDPGDLGTAIGQTDEIPFQEEISHTTPQRRLISRTRVTYASGTLDEELPLGQAAVPALPWRTYQQAFAPGHVVALYGERLREADLSEAGYVLRDGVWWAPSGRQVFDAAAFFQPVGYVDPFGARWDVEYDVHALLPTRTTDPRGNTSTATLDYRVVQPWLLTDPNGNRDSVRYDELGMVVATAVMGKPDSDEGDTLDRPTTRVEYDLDTAPIRVHTYKREQHGSANTRWQESVLYSDGTGRAVLTKVRAEPGDDGKPRWVGTGRIVYDNKGNPVKQYEPYFASSARFDTEAELVESGVTPIFRYDPLGRLVRTDYPDGTSSRVELDAWTRQDWDAGDTVLESRWYAERTGRREAELSAAYARTCQRVQLDSLGRAHVTTADNGEGKLYDTTVRFDVQGNERAVIDARGVLQLEQRFDLLGHPVHRRSADAGEHWSLLDVTGEPVLAWDGRGVEQRWTYDALRRPTSVFAGDRLRLRYYYGESLRDAGRRNLRGEPYLVFDGVGVTRTVEVDFKGNVTRTERWLARDPSREPDWRGLAELDDPVRALAAARPLLEPAAYAARTEYDALDRPVLVTTPDGSRTRPAYNEANLLERVDVALRGADEWTPFVTDLNYNARGQRTLLELACGTRTRYDYEPETFRLRTLTTVSEGRTEQALSYTYDAVGNVVEVGDSAQQTLFFANTVVEPTRLYEYDPMYRLVRADGREHIGQTGKEQPGPTDPVRFGLPHVNDQQAMRRYRQNYTYDPVGNFVEMVHRVNGADTWRRSYETSAGSDQLLATSEPGDTDDRLSARYSYDGNGNLVSMPHLPKLEWDADNRLIAVELGGGGTAYYQYDVHGQRLRATIVNRGSTETRIYLDGVEIYQQLAAGRVRKERHSLHVMAGEDRIALVETTTTENGRPVPDPKPISRYQLSDHLGSSTIEVNETGALLSYEEFHPYGTTAFHSARGAAEASWKRYRFTGKEKDDKTGLYYHGARYYACWLGRWISCDPAGLADGPNLYRYASCDPVNHVDPTGNEPEKPPVLMRLWEYGKKVVDRAKVGFNVQVDHPIRVQLRAAQRTADDGTRYYSRQASKAAGELGVLVETGKGRFHTELGKLQVGIVEKVRAGKIQGEAELMSATRKAYKTAGRVTGTTVNWVATNLALLSNQATLHTITPATVNELRRVKNGVTTAIDVDKMFEATFSTEKVRELPKQAAKALRKRAGVVAEYAQSFAKAETSAKGGSGAASDLAAVAKARSASRGAVALGAVARMAGMGLSAFFVATDIARGDWKAAGLDAASIIPTVANARLAYEGRMAIEEIKREEIQRGLPEKEINSPLRWKFQP